MTLPASIKIYVAAQSVHARKSFDALSGHVEAEFDKDPLSGHVFVFVNRRGHQIQSLFFDRNGFTILKKRLEAGTFRLARTANGDVTHVEISAGDLALMLEGLELDPATRSKRYRRPRLLCRRELRTKIECEVRSCAPGSPSATWHSRARKDTFSKVHSKAPAHQATGALPMPRELLTAGIALDAATPRSTRLRPPRVTCQVTEIPR